MLCDACRREAVIFQPYSGKHLCPEHFTRDFEAKAKRTIRAHGWLRPDDHIAVAFSGDAAGTALLSFLLDLTASRRDIRLSAISIDPGIAGYPVAEKARAITATCGVPWFPASLEERYGITVDELVRQEGEESASRTCRVLSGDLVGEIAAAHGVTRCAFATSVDETAESFFADLLAGTPERTLFSRNMAGRSGIPAITPFMGIPEPEIARYAELHAPAPGPCGFLPPCPLCGASVPATGAQEALDAYDRRHPATKFALANLAGTLASIAVKNRAHSVCPACGEPLAGGECEVCRVRRDFGRSVVS
jgi:tRNA(Ile)-lysidine synthase TilS/MesJ